MNYNSTLSMKRIILSLITFSLIPVIKSVINIFTHCDTISYTFALNLVACVLIMYDWNLFGIHWNRFKDRSLDSILYTAVGVILIAGWFNLNQTFLKGNFLLPDKDVIRAYEFASPAILIAYSFSQAAIVNISFKCLTDHMDIRDREVLMILMSGFLFGLLYTLAFTPLQFELLIRTYLFNMILVCILSYLYNQSSSFIPGIISFGLVILGTCIF